MRSIRFLRLVNVTVVTLCAVVFICAQVHAQTDPLPSWNEGRTKAAIVEAVRATTDQASPSYLPPQERVATFDQDGTLWVEQPMYPQVLYALHRVPALVAAKPELKDKEPYKTVLSGDREAIAELDYKDIQEIMTAVITGMTVEQFAAEVTQWITTAKHPRWNRLYTELSYQPMQELLAYLRANGYATFMVTGGIQDLVRTFAEPVYGFSPNQVVGTIEATKYGYDKDGKPILTRQPKVLLNNIFAGKPEGIQMMIGRRPVVAVGNSTGDREMLEYTMAGDGARLSMILLHDDAEREYAYGPAQGLPDSKVGTFTQALYDEAIDKGWIVISMKRDWNVVFPFEKK